MIAEVKGAGLLQGFPGRSAADLEALEDALGRVSYLAMHVRSGVVPAPYSPAIATVPAATSGHMTSTTFMPVSSKRPVSPVAGGPASSVIARSKVSRSRGSSA